MVTSRVGGADMTQNQTAPGPTTAQMGPMARTVKDLAPRTVALALDAEVEIARDHCLDEDRLDRCKIICQQIMRPGRAPNQLAKSAV